MRKVRGRSIRRPPDRRGSPRGRLPATSRSTPTGRRSTRRPSCTTRRRTPTRSTPAPTPGRCAPPTPQATLAQALHDHADRRGPDRLAARAAAGRRDGRARPGPRVEPGTPTPRGSAATLGAAARRRDRWRPGGDGGGQPRRLPRRLVARRRWPRPSARWPACRRSGRRSTSGRRRRWPWSTGSTGATSLGDPDLVLRPRAAERLRHRDREVLPQRHPRGDPAADLRRRDRVPARRRRAPCRRSSRTPARTTTPTEASVAPMVLVGRTYWTETAARLAAAPVAGPRPGDGAITSTWSTPSTTPPR